MSQTLDEGQYTLKEIEKYEAVYGRNFISPGGIETAQEFTALMGLQAGMRVLDVGCGIGGGAFYMATQYGVQVDGLDLSANMLRLARERCAEAGLAAQVTFVHGDILTWRSETRYDALYSRDVFLHIHDKVCLMQALYDCLKPGGVLLFTDYCCGAETKSADFAAYVAQRNYALCTVAEYRSLLEGAGFVEIVAEDRSAQFSEILERERAALLRERFDAQTFAALSQSWNDKLRRARAGEQRWGLFRARAR